MDAAEMGRKAVLPTALAAGFLVCASFALGCSDPAPAPTPDIEEVPEPDVPETPPPPPPPAERAGPTCTYHGWCWRHPLPQGNDLHGVWAGGGLVVAVGERGTLLVREGDAWSLEDGPNRELLRDVWGASAEQLWAVGEAGSLWRRGADGWEATEVEVEVGLWSIWGRSADEVYAVGEGGTVLRYDGTSWAVEPSGTERLLTDVFGNADAVFALSVDPGASDREPSTLLLERTPSGWQERESFDDDVPALFVAVDGTVTVAGMDARRRAVGSRFVTQRLPLDRPVNALYGSSSGTVHAVGYGGRIATWNGRRWRRSSLADESRDLFAVAGDDEEAWAVGSDGLIASWNGDAWEEVSEGSSPHLKAVWGRAADDIWAVGDHATLHFDGQRWTATGPTEHDLRAVWGVDDVLLAAGDGGALYRYDGESWIAEHHAGGYELDGIWGADAEHAFVVGKTTWLEHEAGEWREHTERPSAAGVWGSARDDIWVAGREGMHHWDGGAWSAVESTADMILFGVWGSGADDIWAVGAEGRLLHWDGSSWSEVEAPTHQNLLGIWGSGPGDVWVVGHHGTLLHYDGESWRWRDSGTDALLHGVWGSGPGDIWVVGHGGAILHFNSAP